MNIFLIWEHLYMVLAALALAVILGVPLGIVAYLYPKTRGVILKSVDLIQTTPALALLGIIMGVVGAGKPTVITGLALYSLLPVVRNTQLGLSQVSPHLKEAATGMGMSRFYQLVRVEIPLSVPIIFAGLRIATVNAIGTAVFAAYVGGGGIGKVIYTGVIRRNMSMILTGTGVLMLVAIIFDGSMGLLEKRLNRRNSAA
jgi:osmoprotectant transport system permease protein